jgi:hypothetical protein
MGLTTQQLAAALDAISEETPPGTSAALPTIA